MLKLIRMVNINVKFTLFIYSTYFLNHYYVEIKKLLNVHHQGFFFNFSKLGGWLQCAYCGMPKWHICFEAGDSNWLQKFYLALKVVK